MHGFKFLYQNVWQCIGSILYSGNSGPLSSSEAEADCLALTADYIVN